MATSNKVQIDVTADTAQPVSGLGAVKRELGQVGSSAASLEGFAKGAGSGLNQMGQAGETANAGLGKTRAGITSISEQLSVAKTQIAAFISAQLGLGAVKEVAQTADAYQNLQARVKLATGEGAAFGVAFDSIVGIAQRTSSSLEQTGTLFARLTEAGKSSGLATQDAISQSLRLTETINQAVQLSGGSAESSRAAVTQLIQGLQSGVLRGEEFNSVMEQAPRLAKALADGLGVTTGELRKMAEAGALSSETVIEALKGQSETLKTEFGTLPATVGRAIENLSTAWTLYIGEADKATGASSAAAGAINLLSGNLSTVGGLLIDAGQAAAGFTAYRLAQTFTGIGVASTQAATGVAVNTVATVANSAAHQANSAAAARESLAFKALAADVAAQAAALGGNTAATAANTAAKNAAGAAAGNAAIGVGRFAAVLSTLKTFSLIGLLTNIVDIGTALGQGTAKLLGYKDRTEELARADKLAGEIAAQNQALRENGIAQLKRSQDAQFGLTNEARKSIAKFEEQRVAGDSAAEAIAKIGKDFDLSNQPGIKNAVGVLDKLLAAGKLTAAEFEAAWANALKNTNLQIFQVNAQAVFSQVRADADKAAQDLKAAIARGVEGKELKAFEDKAKETFAATTREAERLAQVMDATLRESIRRTGLDFDVISGGMGKAAASAINDTEVMIAGLDRLKAQGVDTAQVLTASIGKGIATADSQKAIEAVRSQIEALRKVLGDKVADGLLDQATAKAKELSAALDAAKPGINSVAEAMKTLGITSDATLKQTAATAREAYETLRTSGTASARELQDAFAKYAETAIKANGGVASEAIKSEAAMRGLSIEGGKAGDSISRAMQGAQGSVQALGNQVQLTTEQLAAQAAALDVINSKYGQGKADRDFKNAAVGSGVGSVINTKDRGTGPVDNTGLTSLQAKRRAGTLSAQDLQTAQAVFDTAAVNKDVYDKNATAFSSEGARSILEAYNAARVLLDEVRGIGARGQAGNQGGNQGLVRTTQNNYTVKIDLGNGRANNVNVASANDAQALIRSLQDARLAA